MNLLTHIGLILLVEYSTAVLPSGDDIHRRNTHHTCDSNDECSARLGSVWPAYKFVCCTTVICDENYGNYYLVHSGCSTKYNCQSVVQTKGYSRFAARFEKQFYDSLDSSLEGDCPATRQKIAGGAVPNATIVSEKPEITTTTAVTLRDTKPVNCSCNDESECCVQIICSDILQKGAQQYEAKSECIPQCTDLITRARGIYTFYMTAKTWERRAEYEREQSAPPVEGTCRETRYFYYWATQSGQ